MARAKQLQIAGTEQSPKDPELQEKCEDLRLLRADRIAVQAKEKAALDTLLGHLATMTTMPAVHRYLDEDGRVRVARFKAEIKISILSEKSDTDKQDDGGVSVE